MMVPGVHDLPLFVTAGLLLNITPGADLALIGARSAARGFRSGAAAALGVGAGCFVHVAAGALGLSALIASSAAAFTVLRWVGAIYLVWLGIGLLRNAGSPQAAATTSDGALTWRRSFAQGFLTNALNPKVALFFLAFLPQFIDATAHHKALAFVVLGAVFAFNGTLVNVAFAALIARLRGAFGSQPRIGRWLARGVGALFVALGVRLAWFEGNR
ncbi:MAG TPA: LysE family translocator [Burkholderiaceae bacterium]|nr:LysE family translocator [Burkholderiaceae bacterium]